MEYALSEIQARIDKIRAEKGISKEQAYKTSNWLQEFQDEEKKQKDMRRINHLALYGMP